VIRTSTLFRLAAAVLLLWFVGGAVAAPLAACCVTDEPCCAASPSGQGCAGCSAMPAVARAAAGADVGAPRHTVPTMASAAPKPLGVRPWKPPD
jgi:hypothetical protein